MNKKRISYIDSGVNIELGDDVSKVLYNAAKETWKNREGRLGKVIVPFDDFSGVRAIDVSNLPEGTLMNLGFDGVGTKMELAERIDDYGTIAYDLFAMVCDDAVVRGAEPVLIGSILDVNSLGEGDEVHIDQIKQLAQGYIGAAKAANVAIVNGEVKDKALQIANKLRKNNIVEIDLMQRNLGNQFKYANSIKAKKVIVIGPDEIKQGKVKVKDMKTGKEEKVDINKI